MTLVDLWLNGRSPRDVDPAVVVLDVREHPPQRSLVTLPVAGREGSRLTRSRTESLSVSADLELHEPSPVRRKMICQQLARWAMEGGWLTLSDRPGQRLRVRCDAPPVVTSALRWTQTLTVTFTAHEAPWWESASPTLTKADTAAATGTLTLRPPGDRPTVLEAAILCGGAAVSSLTLTAEGWFMRLSDLGLEPGETLLLAADDRALTRLTIRAGDGAERSVLDRRDPESDDGLWLRPRTDNAIRWQASAAVRPTFRARGRWL